ncbi:glycosyltransferase family 9 protein [soil metagenome]
MRQPRFGIIKPCCIGDAVMALPLVDNLQKAHPEAWIEVWCGNHSRPVFEIHTRIDAIVEIPNVPTVRDLPALISSLRTSGNDGFFLLDRSRVLAAACRLAGITVMGTVRNTTDQLTHETDRYLGTLEQAGIEVDSRTPLLDNISVEGGCSTDLVRDLNGTYVTLHPGGAENPGARMLSKRWPPEHWRATIEWLESRSIASVLTGSAAERDLCLEIARNTEARIAAGELSLIESAALAAGGLAYVGPDTGLSHLVAATGSPTIAIFGPTNPRQYGPRGAQVSILAAPGSYDVRDIDLRKHQTGDQPGTREVPVESVLTALESFINRPAVAR